MARHSPAPICPYCQEPAGLVLGKVLYPQRIDLTAKWFYRCGPCQAWVGCHPKSKKALGTPANRELRRARSILHERRIDPLWKDADECGAYDPESPKARRIIKNVARTRVYEYLADRMRIDFESCHTALFTLDQCREAWLILTGVAYTEIRLWSKSQKRRKQAA
jgi:zinc-finger-containing domain